jgi:hypothetical protein
MVNGLLAYTFPFEFESFLQGSGTNSFETS